ncbi:zinc finger CCCH domain-containing protein 17 [Selaginella moellendorffii]|uniref:zinc finger CCCH domain-containing protein 17 n=1 Tax=Selaginella moellendorffii TaxID=88036 RepID=UPI000D1CD154|nr:zinc finger CCCH domain-containing protein 17 [Selaginella moellendorffii]|eukprot:XP_024518302.1 zinc finger CCCH domain-containing protein 17 [Selaginella moellendorffii]
MAGMEVDDGPARVGGKRHISSHRIPQVCRYWQEGRCNKGDSCQWLHSSGPGTSGRLDGDNFLVGSKRHNNVVEGRRWGKPRGRRGGGGGGGGGGRGIFTDGGRPRPRDKPCIFWMKGDCNRGSQCNFLHSYSTTTEMEMMTQLTGHTKAVKGIALSSSLYTGGQDKSVKVWNSDDGKCTTTVPMGSEVESLLIASGWLFVGLPNEVRAWNMQTNAQQSLDGPKGQVYALAVCEDTLFAGSQDGSILAWKYNTAVNAFQPAYGLYGHAGAVVTLQAAGGRLYSGSTDKSIRVWNIATRECLFTLHGHSNVVMSLLCWEQFLLSCSLDGYIKVWAATPSGLEVTYTYPEDDQGDELDGALALCGTVDAQGKPVLLCSYNDNTVRLYDLPTFNERGVLFSRDEVRVLQGGPGGLVFSGESSGDVKVWCWTKAISSTG